MKKLIVMILLVAMLAVIAAIILNMFPEVENWLHNVTGWN